MSARKGKIARLPLEIREELNRRLQNGECGPGLVAWLNELPKVRGVLAARFGARAINVQNLCEWWQGGYQDWLVEDGARALARELGREMLGAQPAEHHGFAETLSLWLTGHYAVAARRVRQARSAGKHWRLLHQMCVNVARLRQGDHRTRRLELEEARVQLRERRRALTGRAICNGAASVNQTKSDNIGA